jgi:hypothetical protein
MSRDGRAKYFGVVLDLKTGKVRRIFNPNHDWEFIFHHVDERIERMHLELKDAWGISRRPDAMTWAQCAQIQRFFDEGRNYRPGDADQ